MPRNDPEGKKQSILRGAIFAYNKMGPGATAAQIAKEAGVAVGTPFRYFKTKEDLLYAAFVSVHEHAKECINHEVAWEKSVPEVIEQLVTNALFWAKDFPEEEEFTEKYIDLRYYDFYNREFGAFEAEVLGDRRIADRLGEYVRADCPIEVIHRAVSVQFTAYARYLISHSGEVDIAAFCKMASSMILNSIRA